MVKQERKMKGWQHIFFIIFVDFIRYLQQSKYTWTLFLIENISRYFEREKKIRKNKLLTVFTSANDLQTWPRVFLVFVVNPLYKATPDTPNRAATALISAIQILGIKQGYIRLKQGYIRLKQHTNLSHNFPVYFLSIFYYMLRNIFCHLTF